MATGGANHEASEVGWLFVQEYYTFLNKNPRRLHQFYNNKSYLIHGHEGETVKLCHGSTEIQARIAELDFNDCKVLVSNVDSQSSLNGGIIVQVLGEMSNKGGPHHKFAQTFFLAQQPSGYYVLNDVFRFLKEEVDNEYDELATADQGPVIQEQYVNDYQQKAVHRTEPEHHPNNHVAAPVEVAAVAAAVEAAPEPAAPAPKRSSPERAPGHAKPVAEEKAEKPVEEKPAENHVNHAPAAPAKHEAPAPKAEQKPKSWAALASQPAPAGPPKPAPAQSPKKPESQAPAAPKEAAAPSQAAPRRERKEEDDHLKFSVFVRNIKEGQSAETLKTLFAAFGTIKHIDIKKNNALVEFTTVDAARKVIEQQKFVVTPGTEPIYVEEKKRPGSMGPRPPAPTRGGRGGHRGGGPANVGNRPPKAAPAAAAAPADK